MELDIKEKHHTKNITLASQDDDVHKTVEERESLMGWLTLEEIIQCRW